MGTSSEFTSTAQLVLVTAAGSDASICCFEKNQEGRLQPWTGMGIISGHVGKNGVRFHKREGDGCTPAGLFRLGHAFGCGTEPDTAMPFRPVTPESYWVDDPASHLYNTWVEGRTGTDGWASAEHLSAYPDSYALAVVIGYNTNPIVPGKGSAVFLHCGSNPTAGCVAVPEPALRRILQWLNPSKTPMILITTHYALVNPTACSMAYSSDNRASSPKGRHMR